jgi:hypothetical protein
MLKRRFGHPPGETHARRLGRDVNDPFRDLSLPACRHLMAPGMDLRMFRLERRPPA